MIDVWRILGVVCGSDRYLSSYSFIWDDNDIFRSWILEDIADDSNYTEVYYYGLFERKIPVLFYETE